MVTIITTSTESLSRANVSSVLRIDLIVILILIELLIFKEFLMSYLDQSSFLQPETKFNKVRILYIAIVPFIYIFCYVLIYRVLNAN